MKILRSKHMDAAKIIQIFVAIMDWKMYVLLLERIAYVKDHQELGKSNIINYWNRTLCDL